MLIYSKDPDTDRTFFREILQSPNVDAGGGWLMFKLPASEVAIRPGEGTMAYSKSVFYLMCDGG